MVSISSGKGPFRFDYYDGENYHSIENINDTIFSIDVNKTGTYQVIGVNDSNGCVLPSNQIEKIEKIKIGIAVEVPEPIDCILGAVPKAFFSWSPSPYFPIKSFSQNISSPPIYFVGDTININIIDGTAPWTLTFQIGSTR